MCLLADQAGVEEERRRQANLASCLLQCCCSHRASRAGLPPPPLQSMDVRSVLNWSRNTTHTVTIKIMDTTTSSLTSHSSFHCEHLSQHHIYATHVPSRVLHGALPIFRTIPRQGPMQHASPRLHMASVMACLAPNGYNGPVPRSATTGQGTRIRRGGGEFTIGKAM